MKKFDYYIFRSFPIALIGFVFLFIATACSTVSGLNPPRYDSVEYSYVSDALWNLNQVDCQTKPEYPNYWAETQESLDKLGFFSSNQPNDKLVNDAASRLSQIVSEYLNRDNPSSEYCNLKKTSLTKALKELGKQMALEPRN